MAASPRILQSIEDMRTWRKRTQGSVGFVPTMGALHAGHAHLLRRMRARCDQLVLSIFVNPTQFGPTEDLAKYPRTWESDLALARDCGVDAVFYPSAEQIYPPGYSTYVEEMSLTSRLCGEFRPGHFRGVTTVVLKLLNLVRPHQAYFGLKDAQQFFVLHKMARDLFLDTSLEGVATVRERDGLALSSRNIYLTTEQREQAPLLYQALLAAQKAILGGAPIQAACGEAAGRLTANGFELQYLECLRLPDLAPPASTIAGEHTPYLIAVAAHLGKTRLIDNVILRPDLLAEHGILTHD
jgi:pantoate--beta-alanine ligase